MSTNDKRRTAPEIIGIHLGWDMREVSEGRYQRYQAPAVYVCGSAYFCCPSGSQRLPQGFDWELVGTYHDRPVHRAMP